MRQILSIAAKKLAEAGIDTAVLDARILMQEAIGRPHEFIITEPDYELNEAEQGKFEELIEQRLQRKPISQILGKKEFWGMDFAVNEHVLTPRPETELIIEEALAQFKHQENMNILDLGTGSGCILLSLLSEFPNVQGLGVDLSKEALAIAQQNAYNLGIRNVKFSLSNWFENVNQNNFDLIISNPPYIPSVDLKQLEPELGFEPNLALTDNNDGLDCYRKIAQGLGKYNFKLALFEIGINQENEIIEIFETYNLKHTKTIKDLAGIPRILAFIQ